MAIHCAQIWREIWICHDTMSSSLIEERKVKTSERSCCYIRHTGHQYGIGGIVPTCRSFTQLPHDGWKSGTNLASKSQGNISEGRPTKCCPVSTILLISAELPQCSAVQCNCIPCRADPHGHDALPYHYSNTIGGTLTMWSIDACDSKHAKTPMLFQRRAQIDVSTHMLSWQ